MQLTLSAIIEEARQSLKVSVPLIASEIIFALSGFFATIMIAGLDQEILAAHAIVWSIYLPIIVFSMGILFSVSILVSQSFGARDNKSIRVGFMQGLLLGLLSSPLSMFVIWICPEILAWTGQDAAIIELARPAFRTLIWTVLPLNIMIVIEHFFMGINKAYLVTAMSIIIVPIEIFFFYIFIFGKFGFPSLGLSGIGYGLTISYCLITIPFLFYIFSSKKFKIYELWINWRRINTKILFELIKLGLPLGFMFTMETGLFAVVATMMGKLGTHVLAAYQIAYQYLMIALVVLFALIQATTVRVGTEVGKNNRLSLRLAAAINMAIGIIFMLGFSFIYTYFPKSAISLDIDVNSPHTVELVSEASKFLSVVGVLILVECVRLISVGALRGLKDIKFPLFISFIGFWCVAFPAAYMFGFWFRLGGIGIWWGATTGLATSASILFVRFNRISKHINLEKLVTKADGVPSTH
jgi:MATE family multidrug resistance protein